VFPENRLHFLGERLGTRSWWNFPPPPGNALPLFRDDSSFNYINVFYKFIIPSIGISEHTLGKLKLRQNILFREYFTTSLKWAVAYLTAHSS